MKVFSILLILLLAYIAVSDASPSPQSPGIDDITSFGRDKRGVVLRTIWKLRQRVRSRLGYRIDRMRHFIYNTRHMIEMHYGFLTYLRHPLYHTAEKAK
ncbi:uncharacterized protein LOC123682471 isoform X9 [Harmonia axyridis]|uniref:uncharacterized protein LOC123682471 isoform X9 n=1 Tax=Harmonia axyridis TaxID=115357 RepID=UPI001E276FF1|nr:uncharacterized protein LOC123682471 isoform X9 [Harmonia axyridis]